MVPLRPPVACSHLWVLLCNINRPNPWRGFADTPSRSLWRANARPEPRLEAGATEERRLEGVGSRPMLGGMLAVLSGATMRSSRYPLPRQYRWLLSAHNAPSLTPGELACSGGKWRYSRPCCRRPQVPGGGAEWRRIAACRSRPTSRHDLVRACESRWAAAKMAPPIRDVSA